MEPSGAHDRGAAVAKEIGRRLHEVRVARGETLEAIGKRMLVEPEHLEALEAGELDRLPSRHHAAGYARSYAKQLGLDGDELGCPLLALSGWPPPEPDRPRRPWRLPLDLPSCRPRQAAAAVVAVVALASAGWSVSHVRHTRHAAATVALASAVTAPVPPVVSSSAEPKVPDSTVATAEPPAASPVQESPADTARAAADQPVEPAAGQGQLAVAYVGQADAPLPAEAARDAVAEQPVGADAAPAPAAESAAAPPATVEESRADAAPRQMSKRFSVQVASVRDRAAIPSLWASLAGRQGTLAGLEPQAPQAVTLPGRGTFYRVLAGSFASGSEAKAACDRLRSTGTSCVVVAS
jgi:cytoskeletal protein RodZ